MEDPEQVTRTNYLLIPMFVLGSVAFVILLIGQTEAGIDSWTLLVDSAVCGFLLLPLYAVHLVSRFKDGAFNEGGSVLHIISFIVLLGFCVLAMTIAGMGSPA